MTMKIDALEYGAELRWKIEARLAMGIPITVTHFNATLDLDMCKRISAKYNYLCVYDPATRECRCLKNTNPE